MCVFEEFCCTLSEYFKEHQRTPLFWMANSDMAVKISYNNDNMLVTKNPWNKTVRAWSWQPTVKRKPLRELVTAQDKLNIIKAYLLKN